MSGGGKKSVSTTDQKLADITLQTSCYGMCVPFGFGTSRASPNLIYYTDFLATPHTTTTRTGKGGGGGSSISQTTYTYSATVIFALAEGSASAFGQVFHDKEVGTVASYGFTTFDGTRPQSVWPYLTGAHPNDAIAYTGTVLACMANMPLDDSATIGNYSFEISLPHTLPVGTPGYPDANAADFIPTFLSDPYSGAYWDPALIGDLTLYRSYVQAMGLWLSPLLTEQKSALEHLQDWMTATNSDVIAPAGKIEVIPYGDTPIVANGATYTPNTTPEYDLGPSDFLVDKPGDDPIKWTRTDHADTFNSFPIEFADRDRQYNTNTVSPTEPVDADLFGLRQASTQTLHAIKVQRVALIVGRILAQRSVYVRTQFEFRLGWRYVLLLPGDLVTLTEPKAGLSKKVVRIKRLKEDEKATLTVSAEEWPFGVAHTAEYATQSSDLSPLNQLVAPGNVNTPAIFDFPTYLSSTGGAALGVAASGGANWGGCDVYMSADNESYTFAGRLHATARYGTLSAALPLGGPLDTTDTLAVDVGVSKATLGSIDAALNADFANMALVDNELVSYQTATLTGANTYNLTSMYRGVLGTTIAAHAAGARFVRMDENVLEIAITPARIGTTLYFKFLSFNQFGKSQQELSDVEPYTYVPSPGWSLSNASGNFTAAGTVNGIAFTWGANLLPGGYVVELWEGATAGAYAAGTAAKIWEGNATGKLWPKSDTVTRYYWIRARADDGRYGAVTPAGNGAPAAAALVTSAIVLSISPGTAASTGSATAQTTNAVAVTVTGGTAPYTYAWSWSAGGSGLSITSPTSASTTFSATGLALHETRTGTAKCIVTDNIGQIQTIFVSVSISETASAVTAGVSPGSVSASGASATETTGAATVSASGGLGPYTYAWTWQSGGTSVNITSPAAASTTFSANGLLGGETRSGVAQCVVTDSLGQTATVAVSVSINRATNVSAVASPTAENTSSAATTQTTGTTTVTASGGTGSYTYGWVWLSGGAGISINSPTSAATSFTATGLSTSGETRTGTAQCTVTDTLGQSATCTVSVSIQCLTSTLSASVSPSGIDDAKTQSSGPWIFSHAATATPTGGAAPYSYAWSWQSGGGGITISNPTGATATFSATISGIGSRSGVAQCVVSDSTGQHFTVTLSVYFEADNFA
jgi:hypothetical protein